MPTPSRATTANDDPALPIPTTFELLERVKRVIPKTRFDRLELIAIKIFAGLLFAGLIIAAGTNAGVISDEAAEALAWTCLGLLALTLLAWGVSQLIEAFLAIQAGFRPAAETIDREMAREQCLIAELERCDPVQLREKAKHYDLEAKRLSRRAGFVTVLTAIGVVALNLLDAGDRAKVWNKIEHVSVLVYASTLGFLIGSLIVLVLAGRLERISGLLTLAADRAQA